MTFDFTQAMIDNLEATIDYCEKIIYTDDDVVNKVYVIKKKGDNFLDEYFNYNKRFGHRPSKQNIEKDQFKAENLSMFLQDAFLFSKGEVAFASFSFYIEKIEWISLRNAAIQAKSQAQELNRKILQYE